MKMHVGLHVICIVQSQKGWGVLFVCTWLLPACLTAAILPCASITPSQETHLSCGCFSDTTSRRGTNCHAAPYSLSYSKVYGKEYSPGSGEENLGIIIPYLGYFQPLPKLLPFHPRSPKCLRKS